MPELPEVETVACQLDKILPGRKITSFEVSVPKIFRASTEVDESCFIDSKIEKVTRRAKLIQIHFQKCALIVHLKMTGQLLIDFPPDKYSHVIFSLDSNEQLIYRDIRKFGYIKLVSQNELKELSQSYGFEPLTKSTSEQTFFDWQEKSGRANIKNALLNQSKIAGIGNIYASEILFMSKIDPHRTLGSLSNAEIKLLFKDTQKILKDAIAKKGCSDNTYRDVYNEKGTFNNYLQVYRKEGEACPVCGEQIHRIVQNNRSTFYCKKCQI